MSKPRSDLDRREFIKMTAATAVGGGALAQALEAAERVAQVSGEPIHRNVREGMTYRRLGATNWMSSRLVFGCGAALTGGKAVRLLHQAFEAGINYYDTGRPYGDSESQLAPFLKAHRGDIWVVSKAAHMGWPDKRVRPDEGVKAAQLYTEQLEESLRALKTDYIDAYMIMGIEDEGFVRNEDLYGAFIKAREAGKVGHYGLSAHTNVQRVLGAAAKTGWYDLAMVSVTPAGWYEHGVDGPAEGYPTLAELAPVFETARQAGIGLVAMKAARLIESADSTQFDRYYSDDLLAAPLSAQQRSYVHVLRNGLDVANSHMPNLTLLQDNLRAVSV